MRTSNTHTGCKPNGWAKFANNTLLPASKKLAKARSSSSPRSITDRPLGSLGSRESGGPSSSLAAITCGDSIDQSDITTKVVFDEFVRVAQEVSPLCTFLCIQQMRKLLTVNLKVGPRSFQPVHYCHLWPFRAVERFSGPWDHKLKTPILVIGNHVRRLHGTQRFSG